LRFVSAALDTLPQLPEEAGAVEHARAPIVLVEPVEEVELPAQGARAEADYAAERTEEAHAQQPVAELLGLSRRGIDGHVGSGQQAGEDARDDAADRTEHERRNDDWQVHRVQRGVLDAAGGVDEPREAERRQHDDDDGKQLGGLGWGAERAVQAL
jgi:hypothetical protein